MTATRIIDDHTELENIGTNTHAQIDTHIAGADDYIKRDGSLALIADWDIGDTRKIKADEIRARDGAGLKLYDDAGDGIFVKDGGNVGIGIADPDQKLSVDGYIESKPAAGNAQFRFITTGNDWSMGGSSSSNIFFVYDITNAANRFAIDSAGNVGLSITSPTAKLDVNSDIIRLRTAKTPASAGASGNQGDQCWDADYIYVCVATNTWKRAALSSW